MRRFLFPAIVALVIALSTSSAANAWGVRHVGYTRVTPYGVNHYGRTVAVGPYGARSFGSVGHVGPYGAYGGAYHAGYGTGLYGGYNYSTTHYGTYGAIRPPYIYP